MNIGMLIVALAASATAFVPAGSVMRRTRALKAVTSAESEAMATMCSEARGLAMDAIAACHSGHMGLPLGAAEMGAVLFGQQMEFNPDEPEWINRDRFILSAGHGSMFTYVAASTRCCCCSYYHARAALLVLLLLLLLPTRSPAPLSGTRGSTSPASPSPSRSLPCSAPTTR